MRANLFKKMAVYAALAALLPVAGSCVNKKYEMSEDRLDLNVTVFQDGLTLPLGSTAKVRLDSLLNKAGLPEEMKKLLSAGNDGSYALNYTSDEPLDMTENLASLGGLGDIGKIDFSQSVDFSLAGVDASSFSYEGMEFKADEDISKRFPSVTVSVPQVIEEFEISANMGNYASEFEDLDLSVGFGGSDHSSDFVLATIDPSLSVPDDLLQNQLVSSDAPLSVQQVLDLLGSGNGILLETVINEASMQTHLEHAFPKEVKSVSDLHLAEGAKLKITLKVEDPFFDKGSIAPYVELNLEQLLHLADKDGVVRKDHIYSEFVLSAENDWTAVEEYDITGLVLNDDDWTPPNNPGEDVLWLNKTADVTVSGQLGYDGLMTSLSYLDNWLDAHPSNRQVQISVGLEFVDFVVEGATVELTPVNVDKEEPFNIEIPQMSLPLEVVSVDDVVFSDDSKIEFSLDAADLVALGDLEAKVKSMAITFPSRMKVEGADENNTVMISDAVLGDSPLVRQIRLLGIELDTPDENGKIPAVTEPVIVKVALSTEGKIHTDKLPQISGGDVKIKGKVVTDIEIKDYAVKVSGFQVDSQTNPDVFQKQEIKIAVPQEMSRVQGLAVKFKNDPAITINVDIPQVSAYIGPKGDDGFIIRFPEMLHFKTQGNYPYLEWFDQKRNALVFPDGQALPETLTLPIDCLVVNPVLDENDNKYYVSGDVQISGAIGMEDGSVLKKADVDLISTPGTKFAFEAVIPALEVDAVSMDAYSATIEETVDFAPFESVELPQELAYVGEIVLDEAYLAISMSSSEGFPDLGPDSELSLGMDITLPEFIKVDDARCQNGKLSVLGVFERTPSGKLEMSIDPVKINSIEINSPSSELEDFKGTVGVTGTINISGAELDMDEWLDGKTHQLDFAICLATMDEGQPTENIGIQSVSAKVDYQVEPIRVPVDLSSLAEVLNGDNLSATIDLTSFFVSLSLDTNLGIPLFAEISAIPYFGPDAGEAIDKTITISGAESSEVQKKTTIWLSNQAPEAGSCDQFIEMDILSLLYEDDAKTRLLDSLVLSVSAGVDSKQMCVFEPSAEYNLTVDYAAGMPLSFGEDFKIVYRDTITGLSDELSQIIAYGGALGLGGEVENSLPFNVSLKAILCDAQGNKVGEAVTDGPLIKSADVLGQPVKSKLDLILSVDKDALANGVESLQIELCIDSKDAAGVPLREDSFIQIKELYAKVPQGLSLDLSGALSEKSEDGDNN